MPAVQQQVIRNLHPSEFPAAGALVGRALRDSPVAQKLFPTNPAKRAGALGEIHTTILRQVAAHGKVLGAFENATLVAVCAVAEPGRCQPSAGEALALGRVVSSVTSMGTALAYKRWQAAIARRDPEHRHWHIGPVAVEPGEQRRGIGRVLLEEMCRSVDLAHEPCFLATDQRGAVEFFAKFGFKEYLQVTVNECPHWFMLRSPA